MLTIENFRTELEKTADMRRRFLLAVSGGADSMVMLNLMMFLNCEIQVAHINYKLRGESSDADQKLVEDFCKKHDIKIHIYTVSEKDKKPENSIQNWARELRYQFFREIMVLEKMDFLLTAHHLNDQLETFLIHLSRGAGIKGLCGIPNGENQILRPLLNFTKEEIYDFAKENNIEFREDASNKKNDYLRNKIRNKTVPELLETNEHFLENFSKSVDILKQAKTFIDEQIQNISEEITIKKTDDYLVLDRLKLSKESLFVKFEILSRFGFDKKNEFEKIFNSQTGNIFNSHSYQLLIERESFVLTSKESVLFPEKIHFKGIYVKEDCIKDENGVLTLMLNKKDTPQGIVCYCDFDKLNFPLRIRNRNKDDIFYPTGMAGRKKLSRYFKDEKFTKISKERQEILTDAEDNVIWIIAFRQDKRYAIDNNTKDILKIMY